jgi:hypothetical protein
MNVLCCCFISLTFSAQTFTVQGNDFLKDGKPYRYVSGSYHYFRDEPELWEDRIRKMVAGGLNAVQTYVAWNLHEPTPGNFTWTGRANIEHFVDLCTKYNMSVIMRPGPYICAEWAIGGLPYWLETIPGMETAFRSISPLFMNLVDRFWTQLFKRLKPKLYINGGSIILVQVENEYGNFGCDHAYMNGLADLIVKGLGSEVVLITADNPTEAKLNCGGLPKRAVMTLNFGPNNDPRPYFATARTAMGGTGPYVTSEYWTDYGNNVIPQWGVAFPRHTGEEIAQWLDRQLTLGASVNMYMYYGGSNFLYPAGMGSTDFGGTYKPFLPSYDYDAPLTEAGDFTNKFVKVRDVIAKYFPIRSIAVTDSPKLGLGPIAFTESVALTNAPEVVAKVVESADPLTLEELDVPYGYAVYQTNASTGGALSGWVFDHGVLSLNGGSPVAKSFRPAALSATVKAGDHISILVTGLGRFNASPSMLKDRKGLRHLTIGGVAAKKWKTSVIPLTNWEYNVKWEKKLIVGVPAFYRAVFNVEEPADTFLNTAGFNCGLAFLNGERIGRFWKIGPQRTLYVRAQYLKKGPNELVIFETGSIASVPSVTFDTKPILDGAVTPIAQA